MDKKSQQLGINYSTAAARLDRQVLFMLVKECGRDKCHRCGKAIEKWQDLSTEHKADWLDVNPALFWDLSNIAFSHKWCNSGAGRKTGRTSQQMDAIRTDRDRDAPEGLAWCAGHKKYLARALFNSTRTRRKGMD